MGRAPFLRHLICRLRDPRVGILANVAPPPLLLLLFFFVPISFHIQKQEPAVFDEVRLMKCVWLSPRNAPLNIIRLRSAPRI